MEQKIVEQLQAQIKRLNGIVTKEANRSKTLRNAFDQLAHDFYNTQSLRLENNDREMTEQEEFWSGVDGTSYSMNNAAFTPVNMGKVKLWQTIMSHTENVKNGLELGCNVGLNLRAINHFAPEINLSAVEINSRAATVVRNLGYVDLHETSIFDFDEKKEFDFIFIRGVLMHLNVDMLPKAYDVINSHACKYTAFVENFSEEPEPVTYRGRDDLLVSRHFAQEFCQRHTDWKIIADGWDSRNEDTPSNRDIRWFVMKKQ